MKLQAWSVQVSDDGIAGCIPMILSLPRTDTRGTRCGGEMAGDLRSTRDERRWHLWRNGKDISWSTICTNVVLVGSELAAFSGDPLEILLCRSVGIADLKEKTLLANGLTMEFLDDLLTDVAILESAGKFSNQTMMRRLNLSLPSEADATTVIVGIPENSARTDFVVHEDSTKLLQSVRTAGKTA